MKNKHTGNRQDVWLVRQSYSSFPTKWKNIQTFTQIMIHQKMEKSYTTKLFWGILNTKSEMKKYREISDTKIKNGIPFYRKVTVVARPWPSKWSFGRRLLPPCRDLIVFLKLPIFGEWGGGSQRTVKFEINWIISVLSNKKRGNSISSTECHECSYPLTKDVFQKCIWISKFS